MMKIARLVALAAAGLFACMPAAAQRLANFPAAGTVSATDTVLGQQPSLCATNATVCNGVQISAAQLSAYILPGGVAPLATKLATARTINGVAFDGSAPIMITAIWPTARTISGSGDVNFSFTIDGSSSGSYATTLSATGVNAGTYGAGQLIPQFTVDLRGRITSATTIAISNAVAYNIGTSGASIPLLNGSNTWSAAQTFGSINASNASFATPLPASSGGTGDAGTGWTSYAPAVACSTGSITSSSNSGRYKQIGKTVFYTIRIIIGTNGSCSAGLSVSLPTTAINGGLFYQAVGQEVAKTGNTINARVNPGGSVAYLNTLTNGYPGGDGYDLNASGVYEAQ